MKPLRAIALTSALPREVLWSIVRIVLLYALFAGLWILLSDSAMAWLLPGPLGLQVVGTLKGLAFVAVTSVLLFFLVLRFAARQYDGAGEPGNGEALGSPVAQRKLIGGVVLLSAVFVLLGAGGIVQNWRHHRLLEGEQLQAIARLKAAQIESWLEERRRDAEVVRSASILGEGPLPWREPATLQRVQHRLEAFRLALGHRAILLVDAAGQIVLQAGAPAHGIGPALAEAVQEALAGGQIRMTGLFRMETPAPAHLHLDFVAPLPPLPGQVAGQGAVVLRTDAEASLYPYLQSWPVPSETAESLLFRREGDEVVPLNEFRHQAGTALALRVPLSDKSLLAVRALAPEYRPGSLLEGGDYRGTPVIGVAQPIAGTDWWLMAKTDQQEMFAEARKDALWIVFASLLTWLVAVTLAILFFQRRELRHAQAQRLAQAEKLRTLQLLDSVASASNDVMFAQDNEGRFILFNKAAEALTGKRAAEALGRDETALFPLPVAERLIEDNRKVRAAQGPLTFEDRVPGLHGEPQVFLTTKGPLRDGNGRTVGMFGIARDITLLKRNEVALRRERDLNQRYLETMQTLMVALDAQGRITMINRAGRALLGYAEEDLIGQSWFERCLPQPAGTAQAFVHFRRIMAGELIGTVDFEGPVRCRDGSERLIAWHAAVLNDEAGQIVGTLSSGEDITQSRLDEEALRRQTRELQSRNAELERFNRAMVGRELDMIELKRQVNALSRQLGQPPPFDLAALGEDALRERG